MAEMRHLLHLCTLLLSSCAFVNIFGLPEPGCLIPANRTRNWGSPEYSSCFLNATWEDLAMQEYHCSHPEFYLLCEITFKNGGLGDLVQEDQEGNVSTWVCEKNHPCAALAGDAGGWFCFVYSDHDAKFIPWGPDSELLIVAPVNRTAVDEECSKYFPRENTTSHSTGARRSGELGVSTEASTPSSPSLEISTGASAGPSLGISTAASSSSNQAHSTRTLETNTIQAHSRRTVPTNTDMAIQPRCQEWLDQADSWDLAMQEEYITMCMVQECEQSLESPTGSVAAGCRFVNADGFCYSEPAGQQWCLDNPTSELCNDGGADLALPPLGSGAEAAWAPSGYRYRGDFEGGGVFVCSCMKECSCWATSTGVQCHCADVQQQAVGPGSWKPDLILPSSTEQGHCHCQCERSEAACVEDPDVRCVESCALSQGASTDVNSPFPISDRSNPAVSQSFYWDDFCVRHCTKHSEPGTPCRKAFCTNAGMCSRSDARCGAPRTLTPSTSDFSWDRWCAARCMETFPSIPCEAAECSEYGQCTKSPHSCGALRRDAPLWEQCGNATCGASGVCSDSVASCCSLAALPERGPAECDPQEPWVCGYNMSTATSAHIAGAATASFAGDVNGDGKTDVALGNSGSKHHNASDVGQVCVVLGAPGKQKTFGFGSEQLARCISGVHNWDRLGVAVGAAGDVNDDGLADLVIGADGVDAEGKNNTGAAFVWLGSRTIPAAGMTYMDLDGRNGFTILGASADAFLGSSVSGGGDFNGDGLPDVIVGAPGLNEGRGAAYVIYGNRRFGNTPQVDTSSLPCEQGIAIELTETTARGGHSVAMVGDVNGDGYADVAVGAPGQGDDDRESCGWAYIVYGRPACSSGDAADGQGDSVPWSPGMERPTVVQGGGNKILLPRDADGRGGMQLVGFDRIGRAGSAVSAAGDVDGDGVPDMIVGAHEAAGGSVVAAGESYVVYGGQALGARFELGDLAQGNGSQGFVVRGAEAGDWSGYSVSGGSDVDRDGLADVLIGAPHHGPFRSKNGAAWVVYGNGQRKHTVVELGDLRPFQGAFLTHHGGSADKAGTTVRAGGDLNADLKPDLLVAAAGAEAAEGGAGGAVYLVWGLGKPFFEDNLYDYYEYYTAER